MSQDSQHEIQHILRRTVDNDLLGDMVYSSFGNSGNTFFALRYLSSLLDETGEPFWYLRDLSFYSSRYDHEKQMAQSQGAGWIAMGGDGKSLDQKLKEQVFRSAFIQFYGIFFNNKWWVDYRFHLLGNDIPAEEAANQEQRRLIEDFNVNSAMYFREQRLSPHSRESDYYLCKYGHLPSMIYYKAIEQEESQNEKFIRFVEAAYVEPFITAFRYYGMPDRKYTSSVVNSIPSLISSDFRYCIFSITTVTDSRECHHLFFLADCFSGVIYEWKRWPIVITNDRVNPFVPISEQLSSLIRDFDYRLIHGNISVDFEDSFWHEHVLPKGDDGVLQYLVPVWQKNNNQWLLSK